MSAANLGTASWLASGGATSESSAVPTDPRTSFAYARVAGDLDLDSLVERVYTGEDNDIAQVEVDAKLLAVRRTMGDMLINGDSASNQPDGLRQLLVAGRTVGANNDAANGGALLLSDVDRMLNLLAAGNGQGPERAIIMNLAVLQKWLKLHHDAGIMVRTGLDPVTGLLCFYHGTTKVLISDWIPNNLTKGSGTNLSIIFGVVMGFGVGLFGAYKAAEDGEMFEIEREMVIATDQHRYRISANIAYCVTEDAALVACDGIA